MTALVTQDPIAGIIAGAPMRSLIPTTFDGVWEMAKVLGNSPFVPKEMKTNVDTVASAIMLGLDIGLSPIQAVQSIAVINGRPSIWGDAALALCLSHPVCETIDEDFEGNEDDIKSWAYVCTAKRKGPGRPKVGRFTYADAVRADLWNKAGPWKNYPKRMLQLRARAFALRDAFPDVLKGIAIREEQEDIPVNRPPVPPGQEKAIEDAIVKDVVDVEEVKTEPAKADPVKTEAKAADPDKPKSSRKPPTPPKDEVKDVPKTETGKDPRDPIADEAATRAEKAAAAGQVDNGDVYDAKPILAKIKAHFDDCDSVERLELVNAKVVMPLYEDLKRSDQESATHLYNEAQQRIAAADAEDDDVKADGSAEDGSDVGNDNRVEDADTTFPGDLPSKLKPIEEMTKAEYIAHVTAYVEAAQEPDPLKKLWFNESEVRTKIFAPEKATALKKMVEDKVALLREQQAG